MRQSYYKEVTKQGLPLLLLSDRVPLGERQQLNVYFTLLISMTLR